jgi:hypothetical protein
LDSRDDDQVGSFDADDIPHFASFPMSQPVIDSSHKFSPSPAVAFPPFACELVAPGAKPSNSALDLHQKLDLLFFQQMLAPDIPPVLALKQPNHSFLALGSASFMFVHMMKMRSMRMISRKMHLTRNMVFLLLVLVTSIGRC